MTPRHDSFDLARQDAGLTQHELWVRYFALGGMTPALELEAVCHGAMVTTDPDHDRIAHALNERFTDLGRNHPVGYARHALSQQPMNPATTPAAIPPIDQDKTSPPRTGRARHAR